MTQLAVNSRCLAFHGPLLYEAKAIKVYNPVTKKAKAKADIEAKTEGTTPEGIPPELENKVAYFVHYKGWKSSWDEWVSEDRVLAWNEENIRTQKELKQTALAAVNKKKAAISVSTSSTVKGLEPGKKRDSKEDLGGHLRGQKRVRGIDLDLEKEEDYFKRPEINVAVPDLLKAQLVDDWEYVTKEHQLVTLPRKPNVVEVLKMYRASLPKKRAESAEGDIFDEVLSGIKLYFDRSLGNILLYRFEREQYLGVKKSNPDAAMSTIYGAEHLLRLFVTLPGLIAQTNMDQQSITVLKDYLEDLLRFMAKNQEKLFQKVYDNTSSQYEAVSRGL